MGILLTGGAGYIGSHIAVRLLENKKEVIILDNLSNSKEEIIDKIEEITGKRPFFYKGDCQDKKLLSKIFCERRIDAVIHLAGFKAVGESVEKPLSYYDNNINSTLSLLWAMNQYNVKNLIFSSSATVYGENNPSPISEDAPAGACTNPYGRTKYFIEEIIKDYCKSDKDFSAVLLRYFNPAGAHKSGLIGENPNGIPNNLMPYLLRVASGKYEKLSVFGNDYDTPDGTGVRDFIHVEDLAEGHVKAIDYAAAHTGAEIINLGRGEGVSVLFMVHAFEKATGVKVPYEIAPRRDGDIATCFANAQKADNLLGWKANKNIEDICRDAWNFEQNNR